MNIQCTGCNARYLLDERLFQDARAVRVKCRKCGGYIIVARQEEPAAAPPAEPELAVPHAAEPPVPPVALPAPPVAPPPAVVPAAPPPAAAPRPEPPEPPAAGTPPPVPRPMPPRTLEPPRKAEREAQAGTPAPQPSVARERSLPTGDPWEKDDEDIDFERFLDKLKPSPGFGPNDPAEEKPPRPAPTPAREDWVIRPDLAVRPVPPPSPAVRAPAASAPPAAAAGEAEAGPREGRSPFFGNLVLFPSEFKGAPPPTEEKQPPEPAPVPSSGIQPDLPSMPPPGPPDPVRTPRVSPVYNVSRSVVLDPKTLVENRIVAFFPDAPELEPYRVLRTRILQAAEKRGGNTVMITSALPREGKTVTAINLAMTFSKTYLQTALLVDCDLRQQQVQETLGFGNGLGLGNYLTDGCPVSDMMVWPGVEKLTLISGGKVVGESSELLGSPAMQALVEEMKNRYPNRYVFFDVPPVLAGADALAFAPLVDHILFVVRADETPLPELQKALRMLPKEKVIGLVLNRQQPP